MRYLALVAVLAGIAHADPRADATYQQGEALFAQKRYLDAAKQFEASFALDPDPAVLFNIAQAYRLGHACMQAARYYHDFLAKVPNPPDRAKLDRNVAEMDACAQSEAAATRPTVIHETKVVHEIVRDRRSLALPLAIGGGGLIALGIGAYFTYDVHAIQRDRDAACPPGCVYGDAAARIDHLDHRGKNAELGEALGYSIGATAVIAAAVLFVVRGTEAHDTLVTPAPGGAAFSWTF